MRPIALLLLFALLVACSGPSDPPSVDDATPDPSQPVDVTPAPGLPADATPVAADSGPVVISYADNEEERAIYEPLAQKFMAEHPNIKVVFIPLQDLANQFDRQANLLSELRNIVSNADTVRAWKLPPETFGSNLLLDLKPLMDSDAAFKREDFYPGALDHYAVKGGTWLLPYSFSVPLLSYNKDLFKLAKVPAPRPGWTWNDMLAAAQQIGKTSGGHDDTFGFLDPLDGFTPLLAILQAQGIDLLNTPARDVRIDRPEIVAAVEQVRQMIDSGVLISPSDYNLSSKGHTGPTVDPQQLIRDGRVGIWSDGFGSVQTIPADQQKSAPLPFAAGKATYPSYDIFELGHQDGYFISAGTQHPQEAWAWIEFLSRQPTYHDTQRLSPVSIPARESLAEQIGFWKDIDDETAAAYKWTIAHPPRQIEQTPDSRLEVFGKAITQLLTDKKLDAAKTLAEAQQQLEDRLAQAQLTPTATPDTSPLLVATPEPQEAPAGAASITFDIETYDPSDLRPIAQAFRRQHPEVFVQIKATQGITEPHPLLEMAQNSDCFMRRGAPRSDAEFKSLLDLQPLFDADPASIRDDFPTTLLMPYQHNGGLFGLPSSVEMHNIHYNKTAFDAAGLQPPNAAWKPDDFLAAAQALTKGEGDKKQYGYMMIVDPEPELFFFVGQFGARLTRGSGADTRPNFDDPNVVAAIQWYIDLAKVHKVMPWVRFAYRRDHQDADTPYIPIERAGMWFDWSSSFDNDTVGIAAMPLGATGLHLNDFYTIGLYISAHTQQVQACWEWLKFLSAEANPSVILPDSFPARRSVARSEAFTRQASPGQATIAKAYADALTRESQPGDDPYILYGPMDLYWFYKAVDETITKDVSLAKGLAEAQKLTEAFMDCLAQSGTPPKPATCASKVDPAYQGFNTQDPK